MKPTNGMVSNLKNSFRIISKVKPSVGGILKEKSSLGDGFENVTTHVGLFKKLNPSEVGGFKRETLQEVKHRRGWFWTHISEGVTIVVNFVPSVHHLSACKNTSIQ